jgi:ACS family hexuronate transporter-like MFS transporter
LKSLSSEHSNSEVIADQNRTNYRWVVIGLAFSITLVNYLDRSAIAYAIGPICREFNLDPAQFGYILGAFGIGYMVMTVVVGVMVDRWGAHKVWSGAALVWSLCTSAMGLAAGFSGLFALRTLLGITEGPHFPALTRVVADWLPIRERARATAYGLAAVPFASVIGAPLISNLVISFGWKAMFAILGMVGIFWSGIWLLAFRDDPRKSPYVSQAEADFIVADRQLLLPAQASQGSRSITPGKKTSWHFMLFEPSLLANNIAFFAFGYLLFFALTWLPGYFEHTYNMQLKQVGTYVIAPWLTAAILLPAAGWLSDWLLAKTGSMRIARSHLIWICQLLSLLCFIPLLFVHSLNFTILMISLGVGLGLMPNSAFYALNCDLAHDRAATSIGIMDAFFALAGILAPILTGLVAKATGEFTGAFAILIGINLIAVIAVLTLQKPDAKV